MLTKTTIALAAVLFAGSATVAAAGRYDPVYRAPSYQGPVVRAPYGAWQSAPVRLQDGRIYAPVTNPPVDENDWYDTDIHDKARRRSRVAGN